MSFSRTGDVVRNWCKRLYPAIGPFFFLIAALIGAAATLVFAIHWLRHARAK